MLKLKLNAKLIDILLYVIGGLNVNQSLAPQKMLTASYAARLSQYLRSIGQYGATPMLVPFYTTSEFTQAFARLAFVLDACE